MSGLLLRVGLSLVIVIALLPRLAWSAVMLAGSDADLNHFVALLNASSENVSFTRTGSALEHSPIDDGICESDPTKCHNFFGGELVFQVNRPETITLDIGRSLPGVLGGAFVGGGRQLIDLQDIDALPSADPVVLLRSSALLHEIIEVAVDVELRGLGLAGGYTVSHDTALFYTNEDLLSHSSRGQQLPGAATARPIPGGLEIRMPWSDSGTRRDLLIRVTGAADIADIRPGFVDTGVAYNHSGLDLQISSVEIAPIPEPETIWLFLAGLGALAVKRRTRRAAP